MLSRSKIACRAVRVAKQLISVRCAHGVPAYASGISQEPLSGLTIGAAFDLTASRFGDRLAVSAPHQQKEWSYSQLAAEVDALATALLGLGLRPGERVGILCLNSVEWITAQYAGMLLFVACSTRGYY
jgi:fatty-acyl-CoA synthase